MSLPEIDLFRAVPEPRTIAYGGRPARCLDVHGGLPAYESETGALLVMETMVAFFPHGAEARSAPMLFPLSYSMTTLRAPSGLTALHDDVDAVWSWRPLIYLLKVTTTQRMGSQQELEYRIGIHQAHLAKADLFDALANLANDCAEEGVSHDVYAERSEAMMEAWYDEERDLPFTVANRKAEALLREHLTPVQRLQLVTDGEFYVRGTINRLYSIRPGNGAAIVNPETHEELVSLCIHPDDWIPDADVALSLKLMIESGKEGEEEMLAGAKARPLRRRFEPTDRDRHAWRLERDLLPAPLPG